MSRKGWIGGGIAAVVVIGLAAAGIARAEAPTSATTNPAVTAQEEVVLIAPVPHPVVPLHEAIVFVTPLNHPAPPQHRGTAAVQPAAQPAAPHPTGANAS